MITTTTQLAAAATVCRTLTALEMLIKTHESGSYNRLYVGVVVVGVVVVGVVVVGVTSDCGYSSPPSSSSSLSSQVLIQFPKPSGGHGHFANVQHVGVQREGRKPPAQRAPAALGVQVVALELDIRKRIR